MGVSPVPEWAQVLLAVMTIAGSVLGSVAAVSFRSGSRLTKIDAAIAANALAIGELTKAVADRATAEQARGLQAQITRTEGALTAQGDATGARIDRLGARVDRVEETHAARESNTAAILGRLEAVVGGLKESVERLIVAEAEQRRAPAQGDFLSQLQQFAAVQKMLKGVA